MSSAACWLTGRLIAHVTTSVSRLREQLAELKAEVEAITAPFRLLCSGQRKFAPQNVDHEINAEIIRKQMNIEDIKVDLARLQNPAALKAFIDEVSEEMAFDKQALAETFLDSLGSNRSGRKSSKKKAPSRR